MQMIPGLARDNKTQDPANRFGGVRSRHAGGNNSELEAAKETLEQLRETYEKNKLERDQLVDWYERKTNRRVDPGEIILEVLGSQAFKEYKETAQKINEITEKLGKLSEN